MMTMREMDQWVLQLWKAASEARQALIAHAEAGDERARAAVEALARVLDGDGKR